MFVLLHDIIIYLVDCVNSKFEAYYTIPAPNIPNISFSCRLQMRSLMTVTNAVIQKLFIYHHGVVRSIHFANFTMDAHFAEQSISVLAAPS